MTDEQRRQYNKLSCDQKEDYDRFQRRHPSWSHENIMARLAIQSTLEQIPVIPQKPIEEDPEILKEILQGAKDFLISVGCFLWDVFEVIDDAISTLSSLIARGITYIGNKLEEFWDWLTS